ncbi:RES family NAD+ phosphorylase [Mycolicibacter engbaekii]|uniref:RES family NAD+ phosphorylase n=1 Tax=Mycolicibacter engbaekii TaxID=188915 RepID=UPI001F31826F|nr:RES family NAD+ phosphorylase [Mycolicibacter engbaekii]
MKPDQTLPGPPSPDDLRILGLLAGETRAIATSEVWWRVHETEGDRVLAWNALRTYGPLLRFDPHQPPCGEDPGRGVWYGASTPDAALAEAFQFDHTIDRGRNHPYLTGLSFTRALTVLDVATDSDGAWATRVGGTYALSTGPHAVTQQWARTIAAAHPDLDGLRYNSRFGGAPCLALFQPAADAMPGRPILSLPLTHPDLASRLAGAAKRLGYGVV